jgi:hypothetical protein
MKKLLTKLGLKKLTKTHVRVLVMLPLVLLVLGMPGEVHGVTRTWDGGGTDGTCGGGAGDGNKWSCAANWSSDTVPGSSDLALFDGTSDKDAVIDAGFGGTVDGIQITSNYDGTITQSRSLVVEVQNFNQAGGVWNGGSQTLDINDGSFTVSGGTHTATTGTWTLERNFTYSGGTLTMTGATVTIDGGEDADDSTVTCTTSLGGTVNVSKTSGGNFTLSSGCTINVGSISATFGGCCSYTGGITINGTMNHTGSTFDVNCENSAPSPCFFTVSNTGTVTYSGTTITMEGNFTQSGSFNLSGITITFDGTDDPDDSTVTCSGSLGGTVNIAKSTGGSFTLASGCTINVGSINASFGDCCSFTGGITVNGTMNHTGSTFNIDCDSSAPSPCFFTINSGGVVTYSGTDITMEGTFTQNGTFDLSGKTITFDGTDDPDDSTVTCSGSLGGTVNIAKTTGGSFTLASGCTINVGSINASFGDCCSFTGGITVNGTMNHTGSTFNIDCDNSVPSPCFFTVNSGGTVTYSGTNITIEGNFTQNGTFDLSGKTITFDGGDDPDDSTITCGAVLGGNIIINKTHASGNTTIGTNCTLGGNLTRTDGPFTNPGSARTLTLHGNLSMSTTDTFGGGNLTLNMGSNGSQTITQNAGTMSGLFTVNKTGGSAALSTNFITGSTCNVVEGVFDANGRTFTCGSTFTVEDGGDFRLVGSEVVTTPTLNTGSTVSYKGDGDSLADTYTVKNWNYSNITVISTDSNDTFNGSKTNTLTNSLYAYWNMNESSGSNLADSSGNGRDATATGTTVVSGQFGNARSFNGTSSDFISGPTGQFDNFTGGFTVSVWVYPTSTGSWARFIDFGQGQSDDNILFARNGTSSDLTFEVYNNTGSGGKVTATGAITNSTWQHFVATVNSSGAVVIYKNGSVIQTGTTAVPNNVTRNNVYIGRSNWAADAYYAGNMDDLRIFSRDIDANEVIDLYNGLTDNSFSSLNVDGNYALKGGIFTAPSANLTVGGNFSHSGGTFTHNSGTVSFDDNSQNSLVSDNTTFYNFSCTTLGKTIMFAPSSTQTVTNNFSITGNGSNYVTIKGQSPPTQWTVTVSGTASVSYAQVRDSNATNPITATNSINLGNNTGWTFTTGTPGDVKFQRGVNIQRGTKIGQ